VVVLGVQPDASRAARSGEAVPSRPCRETRHPYASPVRQTGAEAFEEFRAQYRAVLRAHIETMSDEQLTALENATETLGSLIDVLQGGSRA
jgi:hypothetical protein